MKLFSLFLLLSCSLLNAKNPPLTTVGNVDIERYMGRWYEIARFDQKFQKNCTAVTADYEIEKNGKVKVTNKCHLYNPTGKLKVAKGKAWVIDKKSNSKLKVQFFLSFIQLPFLAGDYWIIDLDKNYEYAMIGAPNREYLWILSRRPYLNENILDRLKQKAQNLGFDIAKLLTTVH